MSIRERFLRGFKPHSNGEAPSSPAGVETFDEANHSTTAPADEPDQAEQAAPEPERPPLWDAAEKEALEQRLVDIEAKLNDHIRETRTLILNLSLPQQDPSRWGADTSAPAKSAFPVSTGCREEHFREPYFTYWVDRMLDRVRYHRKIWEFVYVCQALYERGCLTEGRRGLGFGVGEEALPALFAADGCHIMATDLDGGHAAAAGWSATAQHAASKQALRRAGICSDEIFDERVDFRTLDMNHIPPDLTGFDFCWSACALEHLGSIEKGLQFIENSIGCLKPGGYAIHTTEFNLSSNDHTLSEGHTVLFRRKDLEALAARLQAQGHEVAPFDFNPGFGVMDNFIDVPPFLAEPHLKLALSGYACTSFGIIVRKANAAKSPRLKTATAAN